MDKFRVAVFRRRRTGLFWQIAALTLLAFAVRPAAADPTHGRCGDGVCTDGYALDTCRLCPQDCGYCDTEDAAKIESSTRPPAAASSGLDCSRCVGDALVAWYRFSRDFRDARSEDPEVGKQGTGRGRVGFTSAGLGGPGLHYLGGPAAVVLRPLLPARSAKALSLWVNIYHVYEYYPLLVIDDDLILYLAPNGRIGIERLGMSLLLPKVILPYQRWHHLVINELGEDDGRYLLQLYIDGELAEKFKVDTSVLENLGRLSSGWRGAGFSGVVDELMLMNRPLGKAEVAALYNCAAGAASELACGQCCANALK